MPKFIIAVLAALLLGHQFAFAEAPLDCIQALKAQFERAPDQYGLVTKEVALTPDHLVEAYRRGIFPWGVTESGMGEWFSPPGRGVLKFDELHIGRSDRKALRRLEESGEYEVTFDREFERVIRACAEQKRYEIDGNGNKVENGVWLSEPIIRMYTELHFRGITHSVEVWRRGKLVAGLYGTFVDGVFSGESMFHLPDAGSDAAKLGFLRLIERLQASGHTFIDTQMAVGLTQKWGAREVPREEFLNMLKEAQAAGRLF
jgi:leucyl/phenylalanyl-tRNA--protein transferase